MTVWVFFDAFTHRTAPRGWASVIVTLLFLGSIQMIGLGIIGEYVRLIFLESKGRPSYIIDDRRRAESTLRGPNRPASRARMEETRP